MEVTLRVSKHCHFRREPYNSPHQNNRRRIARDKISPILFLLCIQDIISSDIILLMFVDDLAILSSSWSDTQINLEQYCDVNSLNVNIHKSIIVSFHKGNNSKTKNLLCNSTPFQQSNSTYLGVPFSSSIPLNSKILFTYISYSRDIN